MREPIAIGEPDFGARQSTDKRFKAIGRWIERVDYDPEKGTRAGDFQTPSHEYAKRFSVAATESKSEALRVSVPGHGDPFVARDVAGVFLQPIKESKRWQPINVKSLAEYRAFMETERGRDKRLMEAGFDGYTHDPMQNATELIDRDEFVPLLAGPFYKQLYIYDYLYMHARAFQLVNHNALAASAIKMLTRFTLGRGLSFHIKNPKCLGVWNEFWERNNMRSRIRQSARDLTWQGELLWKYDEKQRGFLTIRNLDASTCWEIITDPEDIDHVYYYHFQWPTPYQIYVQGSIPVTRYIVRQVPPTNIQHLKINCSSQEKRGRSDLLPAMPWLKRFDDFYNGETLRKVLEANLVWKVKVKGDQADVDAFLQNPALTQLPPPGGTWIENESVDLQATTAQFGAGGRGASNIGSEIAAIVATSLNLPVEYFNTGSAAGSARATALVRTDPAVKTIEDRQQLFRESIEEMYDRVISSALVAKRLTKEDVHGDPETRDDEADDERTMTGSRADRVALRRLDPHGDDQRLDSYSGNVHGSNGHARTERTPLR